MDILDEKSLIPARAIPGREGISDARRRRWRTPTHMHEHEWRASENMPPLSREDIDQHRGGGAGDRGGDLHRHRQRRRRARRITAPVTIARVLIATVILLINMAHVVGILFFESVDYHGPFQHFIARLSTFGTIGALVVSLAIGLL